MSRADRSLLSVTIVQQQQQQQHTVSLSLSLSHCVCVCVFELMIHHLHLRLDLIYSSYLARKHRYKHCINYSNQQKIKAE